MDLESAEHSFRKGGDCRVMVLGGSHSNQVPKFIAMLETLKITSFWKLSLPTLDILIKANLHCWPMPPSSQLRGMAAGSPLCASPAQHLCCKL